MSRGRRVRGALAVALGAALLPLGVAGQLAPREAQELVQGRQAKVLEAGGASLRGELLAVSPDSLWLLAAGPRLVAFALAPIDHVQVRRHGLGAGRVVLWNAIGAVVTGVAMASACSQVEDVTCDGVFGAVALSWGVVGGIFGWIIASSANQDVPPAEAELRPYVRFPQGLPEAFVP